MTLDIFTLGLAFCAGLCAGVSGLTLLLARFEREEEAADDRLSDPED